MQIYYILFIFCKHFEKFICNLRHKEQICHFQELENDIFAKKVSKSEQDLMHRPACRALDHDDV